jgi:hypothetical protein
MEHIRGEMESETRQVNGIDVLVRSSTDRVLALRRRETRSHLLETKPAHLDSLDSRRRTVDEQNVASRDAQR